MIHGFRGTHHGLLLIAKSLRKINKNLDIIIPDLPGFGKGPKLGNYGLESYVAWLESFIKKQKQSKKIIGAPILLGHSFGSIVVAAYAKQYPKTIKKLILVNPIGIPALEGPNRFTTKLAVAFYKIGAKLPEKAARKWLSFGPIVRIMSIAMAKTHDRGLRTYIHAQHDQYFSRFHSAKSVLDAFHTSINNSVKDFASGITTPTLLIAGSLDDITPLSAQYTLVKKFPNAKLKVIDNVGHLTHYETPDKVAEFVQKFI